MELRLSEILRYSGFRSHEPDELTLKKIEQLEDEILGSVTPKSIYREFGVRALENGVEINGVKFLSEALKKNLSGCDKVLLYCCTLGIESDVILRKYGATDSSKFVLAQAIFTEMCEAYSDEITEKLAAEYLKNGLYLNPRFSVGYGDLALEYQREFFKLLEITKRIGVTLNDECMMTPSKSVTAFIGITKDQPCERKTCEICDKTDCQFRKR
jgi:hypothetical protein